MTEILEWQTRTDESNEIRDACEKKQGIPAVFGFTAFRHSWTPSRNRS